MFGFAKKRHLDVSPGGGGGGGSIKETAVCASQNWWSEIRLTVQWNKAKIHTLTVQFFLLDISQIFDPYSAISKQQNTPCNDVYCNSTMFPNSIHFELVK